MDFKKTTHFPGEGSHLPELSPKERVLELLAVSMCAMMLLAFFLKVLFF